MNAAISELGRGHVRSSELSRSARENRISGFTIAWLLLVAVVSTGMFCVVKDGLIDDTYITLASARNLALHGHWGMIPQETANSATSPLNVLLLAAATAVLRIAGGEHTVVALGVLFVGCMVVIAWGWLRLSRALHLATWVSGLGTLVVLVNPFVLSATGLEVHLIAAVLVMLGAMAAEGRPVMYGVVSGIALVTRLDLVIFVLLIALATPAIRRRLGWVLVALGVVGLPWYVFSWLVIGSAIPDTFVIKTLQHSFAGVTYVDGPNFYLYNRRHFWPTLWSFLPAAFGAIALLAWFWVRRPTRLWPLAALGLGGGVYYVAYSVMGVPPYQWYFVAPIVALSMFAVGALGALGRVASGRPNLARRWLTGSGVVLMVAVIAGAGTIDVRHGIPWRTTPVFGNWATPADYAAVGLALHQRIGDATVEAPAEIGTLAYYCDCAIVDPFSDGGRTSELIEKRIDQAGPFSRFILRMNYLWLVRGRLPRPAQYKLTWLEGPGSGPDVWQVWSPATGIGHLVLTSLP